MYNYICETPEVLTHIIDNRKEITHEFVEEFKDKDIDKKFYALRMYKKIKVGA